VTTYPIIQQRKVEHFLAGLRPGVSRTFPDMNSVGDINNRMACLSLIMRMHYNGEGTLDLYGIRFTIRVNGEPDSKSTAVLILSTPDWTLSWSNRGTGVVGDYAKFERDVIILRMAGNNLEVS